MTLTTQGENLDSVTQDIDKTMALARKLMQTKHYEKMGEVGAFAIIQTARAIGMPIIPALNGELYYLQGRVGMGYETMNKYIRLAGHSVTIQTLTDKECVLIGKRRDTGDTATLTFTMEDARKAGLVRAGGNYDKHSKAMLFARCLSQLKRFLFPDVCTKIYEKSELEEISESEEQIQAVELPPVNAPVPVAASPVLCISAEDAKKLDEVIGEDKEYRKKIMEYIRDRFKGDTLECIPVKSFPAIWESALINDAKRRTAHVKAEPMEEIEEDAREDSDREYVDE